MCRRKLSGREIMMKIMGKKNCRFSIEWGIKAVIMALLPLVCCLVSCGIWGYSIGDVYLPASEWNDELFYFKQVEAILEYGYPRGYFGFNESHALKLSFAAWSPVLVFPWVLWGAVFGWNLMAPIWCNLFLLSLAILVFVLLVKPTNKQLGILAVLYCLFPLFTRYILSGMPEIICFSLLIVFYGVTVSYLKDRQSNGKLIGLFVMAVLMTLMRPYLLLFMILPAFLWVRKYRKWWSVAGSLGILAVTFGIYGAINYYLGAEYLTPLFNTDWITKFLEEGLFQGVKFMLGTIWYQSQDFWARVIESFRSGLAEGAFFSVFVAVLIILLWQTVMAWRKKRELEWILCGHGALAFIGMWAALLLMYGMKDGSKHLLTFVVAGIFLVSIMETKYFVKMAVLGVLFVFFFFMKADNPYDYQVPFASQETVERMEYWDGIFSEEMELELENAPNYDNVIIWVFNDSKDEEGELQLIEWQALYALPEGMGISCCYSDYVLENMEQLQSKYIATLSEGRVDRKCQEAGFEEIGHHGELVVYRRGE